MKVEKIIEIFNSDLFDNDVWEKVAYIQSEGCKLSSDQLIDIYDNIDDYT